MPFQLKAAPSSRVRKAASAKTSRKSSLFSRNARTKPFISRPPGSERQSFDEPFSRNDRDVGRDHRLPDAGLSYYISETTAITNVIQAVQYVQNTLFTAMPDSRAGMNSTRVAQVLNFRRSLPPIVSVAHVHALLNAPTKVEREIAELVSAATVRRLLIPGRGGGAKGVGDCLVLVENWEELVQNSPSLDRPTKDKFISVLQSNTKTTAVSSGLFLPEQSSALVRAGFLVSASSLAKETSINPSLSTLSGGAANFDPESADTITEPSPQAFQEQTMFLSLPNIGPYLRLLSTGRAHMVALLEKSSSGEAPLCLLRDRWDGAIESESSFGLAKRARGESAGVLPGKTKKWKDLYGMNFRWALEEALGAGIIEMFDTGSVGPGVRLV